MENRYRYGLIDLSYILSRNVFSCYRSGNTSVGDVVRSVIQTIVKLGRDYEITADKYIFLNDTRSRLHGGYFRTYLLKGAYKTSRHLYTEEEVEEMKANPQIPREEVEKAEENFKIGLLKREAKSVIVSELCHFGLPNVSVDGWEYDDLVRLSSVLLYNEPSGKQSVIITKDSDLLYTITPRLDYFKIPSSRSVPQVITYNQMWNSLTPGIKESGLSLYEYKCYSDSLGSGHNDMTRTKKLKSDNDQTILEILDGNYENVEDRDLFETQLKTFKIEDFPNFDEAQARLIDSFMKSGELRDYSEFKVFCEKSGINSDYAENGKYIPERYYNDFEHNLDGSLYEDYRSRRFHF
jgi:hypothetical protein